MDIQMRKRRGRSNNGGAGKEVDVVGDQNKRKRKDLSRGEIEGVTGAMEENSRKKGVGQFSAVYQSDGLIDKFTGRSLEEKEDRKKGSENSLCQFVKV
ncbi:hypothetical protein ElyMa_005254400 [Elysia marginata]|uniref:Uncharacterized protein n=1 Tax=Elysia marginata TaxID=1093978 RepID=A0AAV4JX65_9GAST|nr:hypothetical protein ElyMa_005254400 [Elysia marginata]